MSTDELIEESKINGWHGEQFHMKSPLTVMPSHLQSLVWVRYCFSPSFVPFFFCQTKAVQRGIHEYIYLTSK